MLRKITLLLLIGAITEINGMEAVRNLAADGAQGAGNIFEAIVANMQNGIARIGRGMEDFIDYVADWMMLEDEVARAADEYERGSDASFLARMQYLQGVIMDQRRSHQERVVANARLIRVQNQLQQRQQAREERLAWFNLLEQANLPEDNRIDSSLNNVE